MASSNSPEQFIGNNEVAAYPDEQNSSAASNDQINFWLKSLGLFFNPFFALNAADDAHLTEYLIGNEVFEAIWGDWVSLVFEPTGGGKTALRVQTAQACWNTRVINRPFPIPYIPSFLKWGSISPTYQHHLEELTLAGVQQLFLGFCHRPHWLLILDSVTQLRVCELLTWSLSAESLRYYLDELHETSNLQALKQEFDPTFYAPDPPDPATLKNFCDALSILIKDASLPPDNPSTRWAAFCDLVLQQLAFPSIYILLDGLDTTLETATNPQLVVSSLLPLLSSLFDWSERHIYLKGFLPVETKQVFRAQTPEILASSRVASIYWDDKKLAEVVRKRVFVASQGKFDSLDAIVTPGLRDFENMLVKDIAALRPREMLTLVNDVFAAHLCHCGPVGKIEEYDWEVGLSAYRSAFPQS